MKTIKQFSDTAKLKQGELVIYKGRVCRYAGLCQNMEDMPDCLIPAGGNNSKVGRRYIYNNCIVEIINENKNGSYSVKEYSPEKKKTTGSRWAVLARDILEAEEYIR